ncbi:MAG: DnaJ domain-containing protein [Geitlerinemataceae cyanobacterium]
MGIQIFDDGKPIFTFFGTQEVNTVAIDADSNLLVGGDFEGTITSWNLESKALHKTLSNRSFSGIHGGIVLAVDLSPTQHTIASGSIDRTVKLWDLQTGELRRTLTGHSSTVLSISIAPNGKTIATASSNEVIIWEIQTGECIQDLAGNSPVIFSPDGYRLVTSDLQNNLRIWQQSVRKKDDRSVLFGKWWKALGVNIDASLEEVKLAYRRLARLYHPDLNPSKEAIERMQALNKAYDEFVKGYTRSVRSI